MELTYKQVEATLVAHLRIHPDRIGRFQSRIKQLQRLGFPFGVNVGRGEKMKYSATHLFQFVTAFELINHGIPGGTAVEIVEQKWDNFAVAYGLALWHRRRFKFNKLIFARVMNATLADLQGTKEGTVNPNVFVEDDKSLASILTRNSDRFVHCYSLLCITDIVFRVLDGLKNYAQVENPLEEDETLAWKLRDFPATAFWMRAEDDWLLDEDEMPVGDPPYFLAILLADFLAKHPELAGRFVKSDPVGVQLQHDEIEVMISYGLLKRGAESGPAPLTPKGRAICQYLRREEEHVFGS